MNPSVGADCSSMDLDTHYYCISWYPGEISLGESTALKQGGRRAQAEGREPRRPRFVYNPPDGEWERRFWSPDEQSGMFASCHKLYFVVAGDECYNIAVAQNIALSNLYAWNPAVKTDCSGLQTGYYIMSA